MLSVSWASGFLGQVLKTALMPFLSYAKKILRNSFLAPAKIKRHFERTTLVKNNISFFEARLYEIKGMQKFMLLTTILSKKLMKVSHKRKAFAGEAHTIAENLVKPCILEAAKILLSENDNQKLKNIPLSDNTESRRIDEIRVIYIGSTAWSSG